SMIGLCYMEKLMYNEAVQEFKKGIDTPGYEPEEYLGLQYDLGLTYELMGNSEGAFEAFSSVYEHDSRFREVSAKLKELRKKVKQKGRDSSPGGNVSYV
ncbi:hypothetical protein ACFL27_22145, partial [candidate division CSSED10-310 bacterium]